MDTTELPFKVEAWSKKGQNIERLIATATNVLVARAAYEAAVQIYPGQNITLRQGARVIAETKG